MQVAVAAAHMDLELLELEAQAVVAMEQLEIIQMALLHLPILAAAVEELAVVVLAEMAEMVVLELLF